MSLAPNRRSPDPEIERLAREREDELEFYCLLAKQLQSRTNALLDQLGSRFGPLPEAIRARVEAAGFRQLDAWAKQIPTAQTLDEIFAPSPEARWMQARTEATRRHKREILASYARAQADLLLTQLGLRFGPPSEVTRARVEAATSWQIESWAKRLLTAQSLDEVLEPQHEANPHPKPSVARPSSEDPIGSLAKLPLDPLSQDPEVQRLDREQEDEIERYRVSCLAISRRLGPCNLLLEQIHVRFGFRSKAAARDRLEAAPLEQLESWAKRLLTAQTIDEVFAP